MCRDGYGGVNCEVIPALCELQSHSVTYIYNNLAIFKLNHSTVRPEDAGKGTTPAV